MGYHKLHSRREFQGLPISIETPAGGKRVWVAENTGEEGFTIMEYPYGYVRGTLGVDGDEVDVFVGPNDDSDRVFVITQNEKPEDDDGSKPWVETDEQKVMLGFDDAKDARAAYLRQYDDPRFFCRMIELTMKDFKDRLVRQKGGLIKGLQEAATLAIMPKDNTMLTLSKSTAEKAFTPVRPKDGSEETIKSEDKDLDVSKGCAIETLNKACAALKESEMDLKKKCEASQEESEVSKGTEDTDITKALRAIAVAGISRRARMDAAYQLGHSVGKRTPFEVEPANVRLNAVISKEASHEPPVAKAHYEPAPPDARTQAVDVETCIQHGYVHKSTRPCPLCESARVTEAQPLWRR